MKTVLLTGATGTIGKSIIKALNKNEYNIAGQYYSNNSETEKLLKKYDNLKMYKADLLNNFECLDLVDKVIKDFSSIDILINNAGNIFGAESFFNLSEENFDKTMNLNFKSHFFVTQSVYRQMIKKNNNGRIISISSISAKYGGGQNTLHYGCAKAALECFTKGLAKEAAKHNILVNCIQLGFIESELHKKIGRTDEEIKKRILMIPLQRSGKPEDAANMIEFLCSAKSDFITGQIFTVSGGD
ncbi:SDR family oxidoreductase [Candidatus Dependentiae bacterium]|nr:SDR family oxidoreductase [Candidatus Dependentiae bacterium]